MYDCGVLDLYSVASSGLDEAWQSLRGSPWWVGRKVPHDWSALASAGSKCKHIVNVFFIGIPYQKLGFLVPDFTECLKII